MVDEKSTGQILNKDSSVIDPDWTFRSVRTLEEVLK